MNTLAAEQLYSVCSNWITSDNTKDIVFLDLCCGTGTIGITMSSKVKRVVGVEIVPAAVQDAIKNAQLNSNALC